jgi:hypothetical protein
MCFQMLATAIWRVWRQTLVENADVVELSASKVGVSLNSSARCYGPFPLVRRLREPF